MDIDITWATKGGSLMDEVRLNKTTLTIGKSVISEMTSNGNPKLQVGWDSSSKKLVFKPDVTGYKFTGADSNSISGPIVKRIRDALGVADNDTPTAKVEEGNNGLWIADFSDQIS